MWLGLLLEIQWLVFCPFPAGSVDCSMPDQGAKIPQIMQRGQKIKQRPQKQTESLCSGQDMKIKEDATRGWFPTEQAATLGWLSFMLMLTHVQLFVTPWTVAHQAPPSMGFSRQEYWSGLPFPPPGDLPYPEIKLAFPESCIGRWILCHQRHRGSPNSGLEPLPSLMSGVVLCQERLGLWIQNLDVLWNDLGIFKHHGCPTPAQTFWFY